MHTYSAQIIMQQKTEFMDKSKSMSKHSFLIKILQVNNDFPALVLDSAKLRKKAEIKRTEDVSPFVKLCFEIGVRFHFLSIYSASFVV